jgi:hypothetical protein
MKFILGFFVGLLTGVTIVLAPLIAVVAGLVASGQSSDDEPVSSTSTSREEPPLP